MSFTLLSNELTCSGYSLSVSGSKEMGKPVAVEPLFRETARRIGNCVKANYRLGDEDFQIALTMKESVEKPRCFFCYKPLVARSYQAQVQVKFPSSQRMETIYGWDREIEKLGEHFFSSLSDPQHSTIHLHFIHKIAESVH